MIKITMKLSRFVLVCSLAAAPITARVHASPPDGYLTEPACGLVEPVGIGVSLPIAPVEGDRSAPRRVLPADMRRSEIEQRIGQWLDRHLRNPDRLRVVCTPAGDGWKSGAFDQIAIDVRGGKLDMVPLSSGKLRLKNVVIDLPRLFTDGEVVITSSGPAEAHLEVSEEGLNSVLADKAEKLKVEQPHIELRDGLVEFSGRMKTLVIKNDVVTAGRFEIVDGAKLNYLPTRLKVGYLALPGAALAALARRFNPIVELARLKPIQGLSFQLERVTVVEGRIILETANGAEIARAR